MWRFLGRIHRHDIDLDAINIVESVLGCAVTDGRAPLAQPMTRKETSASREIADRDRAVVDPQDPRPRPVGVNRLSKLTPRISIHSSTCGADRRSDPTPNNRTAGRAL